MAHVMLDWERLIELGDVDGFVTERARVPGGWLVRTSTREAAVGSCSVAMGFVPDEDGRWDE